MKAQLKIVNPPKQRTALVSRIRRMVKDGTYVTPARVDGTVRRLCDVLEACKP